MTWLRLPPVSEVQGGEGEDGRGPEQEEEEEEDRNG